MPLMRKAMMAAVLAAGWMAGPVLAVDVSQLPPPAARTDVSFAKDIQPIFDELCTRCHGAEKQKGDLRLDSAAAVRKGSEHGAVLQAGQSAKSQLVLSVARLDKESAMPPDRKPGKDKGPDGKPLPPVKYVTPEQVGLIRAWIDQGAQ